MPQGSPPHAPPEEAEESGSESSVRSHPEESPPPQPYGSLEETLNGPSFEPSSPTTSRGLLPHSPLSLEDSVGSEEEEEVKKPQMSEDPCQSRLCSRQWGSPLQWLHVKFDAAGEAFYQELARWVVSHKAYTLLLAIAFAGCCSLGFMTFHIVTAADELWTPQDSK
ncbi:unnamed protein product, partial [Chrysoparadoxa australica]